MHTNVIGTESASQIQPLFSYVITRGATDKVNWSQHERSFDSFAETLVSRGHRVGEKDGSGIVAALMRDGGRLEDKNVLSVTAVILDVDGKIRENGVETIKYVDPDEFISRLPFRGVAHTSYNHSASLSKFRVILPLQSPVSKEDYQRLWWWAYEKCGRTCDPACKNPSRMFYLPRHAADVDPGIHWVRQLRGPYLSMADVPASFEIPGARQVADRKRRVGLHVSAHHENRYTSVDPHAVLDELMRMPVYEWALQFPAEVSREAWRGLATNLAALVVEDAEMYEPCSQAFHNLSCVDPDRYDYGTCERTFRDAVNSARNVGPMTWSTLELAGAPESACGGMLERSPVAVARSKVSRRVREQARKTALERSNGTPVVKMPVEASPFVQELPVTVVATQTPAVAKDAPEGQETPLPGHPEKPPSGPPSESPEDAEPPNPWHDPSNFVFDGSTGEWLQWDSTGIQVARLSDMAFTRHLLAAGHDKKNIESFKSIIPHVSNKKYCYDRSERVVVENGVHYLNLYRPTDLKPIPGDWEPVRQLITNLCGGDLIGVEFVLDWIATPLQSVQNGKPWKTLTAPVFQGAQGSGKGTLGAIMRCLYGHHNFVELTQEALDGRFNDMLDGKLFVVCNEVISTNNRAGETFNKIKTWVADEYINIERKYGDRKETVNTFNVIFTSNDTRPVIVEKSDRRYIVFESRPIDPQLSALLWDDVKGDHRIVSAFFAAMLTRPSRLYRGQLYDTAARASLMNRSLSSWDKFVLAIKEDGWMAVSRDWVNSAPPNGPARVAVEKPGFVSMATVMSVYSDFCRTHGIKPGSSQILAAALKEGLPQAKQSRVRLGRNPVRGWEKLPMEPPDAANDDTQEQPATEEVPLDYRA